MQIGPFSLDNRLILAPMAGITDPPYRRLCLEFGASVAVSEMVSANPELRKNPRTLLKLSRQADESLHWVQILGTDPDQMAQAAILNVQHGADIIDINMGCPAKKVCAVAAGSALMKNEELVKRILDKVVSAVTVPVTLKIRTGWDLENKNALTIAKIAENAGISAITIHGRTRACKFEGHAEYQTITEVKQQLNIPVIANGDIDSPEKARRVLNSTGADALMIGRAAQGNPWIFKDINNFLSTDKVLDTPSINEFHAVVISHLEQLYSFYGQTTGVRMARKHIHWYFSHLNQLPNTLKNHINQAEQPKEQLAAVNLALQSYNSF